jgi:hypothetical protein
MNLSLQYLPSQFKANSWQIGGIDRNKAEIAKWNK